MLTSRVQDEDAASPFIPIPRSTFIDLDTDLHDTTPARSLYPDRPLADASSSGSLTERPARHDRVNSTTITPSDVTKWMEKGTFGSQTPDDLELGIETHVVCMLKGEVQVGSAANEHETGNRADHATGVEATKKLKQYRKSDSLRQISKENGIDQAPQAPALDGHEAADLVVEGVVGD
ncbi:hypothetical protein E8E11_000680 [Didymella keratinophila]|nr:hypothetical protein E8E11_000680 [Didymella keratinophila]